MGEKRINQDAVAAYADSVAYVVEPGWLRIKKNDMVEWEEPLRDYELVLDLVRGGQYYRHIHTGHTVKAV